MMSQRPQYNHTSTSSRVSYAPPGTARPPRAGGGGGGPKGPSLRSKLRDRWTVLLAGPAYLEPGPTNRLVLSLRSCVPSEVDFALERLIQVSSIDPDLLRFVELPGLLDGLLGLIRDYLEKRIRDRTGGAQSLPVVMNSESRETLRRRATEASLILRNLALEKKSLDPLLDSKRFRKLLVQALEEGEFEGPEGEETTELRLYLLEVLEIIGEHIPLAIPGHAIPLSASEDAERDSNNHNNAPPPPPKPEPLDSPSVRLFPLLVALTRSQDRALILSSYRCLTVLSLHEKSDPVFSLLTYTHLSPLPKPHPHPIETAIQLLPLGDSELNSVVLDFMYQHTLLPSNSCWFSNRPELGSILKLLVGSKLEIGAKVELVETQVLETSSEAVNWYKMKYPESFKTTTTTKTTKPGGGGGGSSRKTMLTSTGEPLLSEQELHDIVDMQEPERAIEWMHRMYEIDPDSQITQVSLWTTYRTQFEVICADPKYPMMLAAQEVIRLSGQAFPSAVPTIVDDTEGRKFIIRGLKPRARPVEGECRWQGCPVPAGHDAPLAFHQHVYNTHLSVSPPPSSCEWSNCHYSPASSEPRIQLAQLTLHTRTHLPLLGGPSSSSSTTSPPLDDDESNPDLASSSSLPRSTLHHVRYHAQKDEHHEPTGPSFLACLVLRNLTRAAKLGLEATTLPTSSTTTTDTSTVAAASTVGGGGGQGRISVASGNSAINRLAEGEQSIFEAFALAEESGGGGGGGANSYAGGGGGRKSGGVLQQVEKPDWSLARNAVEALLSVQEGILKTALSNVLLGKYLVEVVVTLEGFQRTLNGLGGGGKGDPERQDGEDGEVKMEE